MKAHACVRAGSIGRARGLRGAIIGKLEKKDNGWSGEEHCWWQERQRHWKVARRDAGMTEGSAGLMLGARTLRPAAVWKSKWLISKHKWRLRVSVGATGKACGQVSGGKE